MVKISQKFIYIFLFVASLSIASDYQNLTITSQIIDRRGDEELIYSDGRQVKKFVSGAYEEILSDRSEFTKTLMGDLTYTNSHGEIIYSQNFMGQVSQVDDKKFVNQFKKKFLWPDGYQIGHTISNLQNIGEKPKSVLVKNQGNKGLRNNQQQLSQNQNQSGQNASTVSQNINFGDVKDSKFKNVGGIKLSNNDQKVDQNITFKSCNNVNLKNFATIDTQPQNQQQPQVVQIVVPGKSAEDQHKVRDEEIRRYEKIIEDVKSNKRYNGGLLGIEGSLSDALKKEMLSHIKIIETERDGISIIQYFDEDKNNTIKNAIGDAICFSWMLNNETNLKNALNMVKNKGINASEIIKTVDSFNKTLPDSLSSKEYVKKIKDNKVSYYKTNYKTKQNSYSFDAYEAAWHANNIVVLHSFEITSECDYIELFTHVNKLRTSTQGAFVIIIEQEKGNPFQVLVNKFNNKIDILTTQKISDKFQQFIMNLFGPDAIKNKFLENRIMELESKIYENQDCLIPVAKAIGIDIEVINAFLKTPKDEKLIQDSATFNNVTTIVTSANQQLNQHVPEPVTTRENKQEQVKGTSGFVQWSNNSQTKTMPVINNVEDWKWVLLKATWIFTKDNPVQAGLITMATIIVTYLFLSRLLSVFFGASVSKAIGHTHITTYSDGTSSVIKNSIIRGNDNKFW